MLVLTRKKSEMIRIGDDIVIKVVRTSRGMVKLGIEAPDEVRVLRAELCEEPSADQDDEEPYGLGDAAHVPVVAASGDDGFEARIQRLRNKMSIRPGSCDKPVPSLGTSC